MGDGIDPREVVPNATHSFNPWNEREEALASSICNLESAPQWLGFY